MDGIQPPESKTSVHPTTLKRRWVKLWSVLQRRYDIGGDRPVRSSVAISVVALTASIVGGATLFFTSDERLTAQYSGGVDGVSYKTMVSSSRPDLAIQYVQFQGSGKELRYRVVVINQGGRPTGKWTVSLEGPLSDVREKNYPSLEAQQQLALVGTLAGLPAVLTIDPGGRIAEYREDNNTFTLSEGATLAPISSDTVVEAAGP